MPPSTSWPAVFSTGWTVGRPVPQRFTPRFETAELDEQEIVFPEREGHLFRRPIQELEQLFVRQQVPVAADDGQGRPPLLHRRDARRAGQTHPPTQTHHLGPRGSDDLGHPLGRNQLPVAPYEGVQVIREMRQGNRCWRAARRKIDGRPGTNAFGRARGSLPRTGQSRREAEQPQRQGARSYECPAPDTSGGGRGIWL